MKISILFDKKNPEIYFFIKKKLKKINTKNVELSFSLRKFKFNQHLFVLGYTRIIDIKNVNFKNKFLIHESNLPKGRGHSPLKHQILYQKKKKITLCLIRLEEKIDSGNILMRDNINIKKTDIYDEIKEKQFDKTLEMINKYIKKNGKFYEKKQAGNPTYFRKLNIKDDEINPNLTLKSQFDKLRITNYRKHPNFFFINKEKIYIKIFKKN
jgi:methionyl-tRNA formyltransferase